MARARRPYRSTVREARAEATRDAIVDAAHRLLRTTRPVDLSYSDVADEAGVSTRTVYRLFPRPEDLFTAVSRKLLGGLLPEPERMPETVAELALVLEASFRALEADPALFRVMFAVPTRSALDQPTIFGRVFREQVERIPVADRAALFAIIDLLGSPYAWDVMHHNWAVPTERAVRAVLVTAQALFDHLAREPAALSPKSPPPKLLRRRRTS